MSGGKFASLTAGLLVRKGEAHPSVLSGGPVVNFPSPERRRESSPGLKSATVSSAGGMAITFKT